MSSGKTVSIETALELVLSDHFENCQNPHETIHRIWLLLNADSTVGSALNHGVIDCKRNYH
jgi:hypothetical protein